MGEVMMKCGHAANAVTADGKPCCAICAGFTPDAEIIADTAPDLTGRKARCGYCGKLTDSKISLPFFEYRPDMDTDSYYCGCRGWD